MEINLLYFIISSGVGVILIITKLLYKTKCDEINLCGSCCVIKNHNRNVIEEKEEEEEEEGKKEDYELNDNMMLSNIYKNNIQNI